MISRAGQGIAGAILVGILTAAFVLGGLRGIRTARSRRIDGDGPLGSSDSFLFQATQVHGSGERIAQAIAALPPDAPLAIVSQNDNVFGPIVMPTIAQFTWPHEVFLVSVGADNFRQKLDVLRKYHVATAIFLGINPPSPVAPDQRIGPLTIVPLPK